MRGVYLRKAQVIAEDERRKIVSILNGELTVKDIHILFMKSGDKGVLGNHKHFFPEVMYVLKGKVHYWLKNKEGEEMECDMEEGDIMFRAPEVVHTCTCSEDAILLDGASESWISEDWNHVREEIANQDGWLYSPGAVPRTDFVKRGVLKE